MAPDGYPARSLRFAMLFLSRARDPFTSRFDFSFPATCPLWLFISAQMCHISLSFRVMTLGSIGFYSSNFYHARLRKSLIIYFTFRRTASWKCFIYLFSCWLHGQCWQYYKFNLPLQCTEFLCVVKPRKQHRCIATIGWIDLIAFTYNKVRI